MAEHLIERLMEPVTTQVKDWLKTRAQRAELRALPAGDRANVLRDLGITESSIDTMANNPGPGVFLPKRLEEVGLDPGYVEKALPATYRDLQRVCSSCPDWKTCRSDIDRSDAVERLNEYCPNTYTIDCLLVGREDEKAARSSR